MNPTLEALRRSPIGVAVGASSGRNVSTQRESAYRGRTGAARAAGEQSRRADIGDDGGRGSANRLNQINAIGARRAAR